MTSQFSQQKTHWRHGLPLSCCWVYLLIFWIPWTEATAVRQHSVVHLSPFLRGSQLFWFLSFHKTQSYWRVSRAQWKTGEPCTGQAGEPCRHVPSTIYYSSLIDRMSGILLMHHQDAYWGCPFSQASMVYYDEKRKKKEFFLFKWKIFDITMSTYIS